MCAYMQLHNVNHVYTHSIIYDGDYYVSYSISQRLSGTNQTAEFSVTEKKIIWKLRRISGKNEASAHFVVSRQCYLLLWLS